jgi:hypothetical protein
MGKKFMTSACAMLALSGCANANSIWRNESMLRHKDGIAIASMDARQRTLVASRNSGREDGSPLQYCAEQAPDMFAVLASSFRAEGDIGLTEADRRAKANIASAMSETAATISRTQSLNLITQLLYRTCEAGLNGRLNGPQMEQALRRNQRLVMSMMAIEQLTTLGQRPRPVVIAGGMATITGDEEAPARVQAAFDRRATARTEVAKAKKSYDEAVAKAPPVTAPAVPSCAAIVKDDEKAACNASELAFSQAKKAEKEAGELYDALRAGGGAGLSVGQTISSLAQSEDVVPDLETVRVIADATIELAKLATSIDEVDEICKWARSGNVNLPLSGSGGSIREYCQSRELVTSESEVKVASAIAPMSNPPTATNVPAQQNAVVTGRIFIQIASAAQRVGLLSLPSQMRSAFPNARVAQSLDIESAYSPDTTEVRYFREQDAVSAQIVVNYLSSRLNAPNAITRNFSDYGRTRNIPNGQLEIWFGKNFSP